MKKPIVSLIFPVYNDADMLTEALETLRAVDAGVEYEVILVDDESTDDMSKIFDKKHLYTKLIKLPHSGNSTVSMNAGVKAAKGKYVQYQNSDVFFKQDGWLKLIVDAFKKHKVGTVGCKTLFVDNTINHSMKYIDTDKDPFLQHKERGKNMRYSSRKVNTCDAVSGCGMTTLKSLWEDLGWFSVYQPFGWDDVDWCLRTWEAGYKVVCQSDAWFYHYGSRSYGGKETKRYYKNEGLVLDKFKNIIQKLCQEKRN